MDLEKQQEYYYEKYCKDTLGKLNEDNTAVMFYIGAQILRKQYVPLPCMPDILQDCTPIAYYGLDPYMLACSGEQFLIVKLKFSEYIKDTWTAEEFKSIIKNIYSSTTASTRYDSFNPLVTLEWLLQKRFRSNG